MDKLCGIILGGEYSKIKITDNIDYIIACDKGYEYAQNNGILPDLFVGDFDSYNGVISQQTKILELPVEKDDTDALAAVKFALDKGYKDFIFFCAFGKRIDHFFGNLQTFAYIAEKGGTVFAENDDTVISVFTNKTVDIPKKENYSLSVFSVSDKCDGVTIKGTKYTTDNITIKNTFPVGVSNEWVDTAQISVKNGILMVIMSKKDV